MIEDQFRIDVVESVKVSIAKYMKENEVNINELGSEYRGLAKETAKNLQLAFDETELNYLISISKIYRLTRMTKDIRL